VIEWVGERERQRGAYETEAIASQRGRIERGWSAMWSQYSRSTLRIKDTCKVGTYKTVKFGMYKTVGTYKTIAWTLARRDR